jgi:hypothetical protein
VSFSGQTAAGRFKADRRTAETVFETVEKGWTRYGWDRAKTNLAQVPAKIRNTPDYLQPHRLVEVAACGNDGVLKLRAEKLSIRDTESSQRPTHPVRTARRLPHSATQASDARCAAVPRWALSPSRRSGATPTDRAAARGRDDPSRACLTTADGAHDDASGAPRQLPSAEQIGSSALIDSTWKAHVSTVRVRDSPRKTSRRASPGYISTAIRPPVTVVSATDRSGSRLTRGGAWRLHVLSRALGCSGRPSAGGSIVRDRRIRRASEASFRTAPLVDPN